MHGLWQFKHFFYNLMLGISKKIKVTFFLNFSWFTNENSCMTYLKPRWWLRTKIREAMELNYVMWIYTKGSYIFHNKGLRTTQCTRWECKASHHSGPLLVVWTGIIEKHGTTTAWHSNEQLFLVWSPSFNYTPRLEQVPWSKLL